MLHIYIHLRVLSTTFIVFDNTCINKYLPEKVEFGFVGFWNVELLEILEFGLLEFLVLKFVFK